MQPFAWPGVRRSRPNVSSPGTGLVAARAVVTMSQSMVHVDNTTIVLLVTLLALLLYARFCRQYNQPVLHPLILQRQSEASAVRMPNESASYRNVNAPLGLDLAMRPQRDTPTVATMLARGVEAGVPQVVRRVLDASMSNEEIRLQAAAFMSAVRTILHTDTPVIVVCGFVNSSHALTALLAPALIGGGARVLVLPPGMPPASLPADVDEKNLAIVCLDAPLLPILAHARLIIANENSDVKGASYMTWDDVMGHATENEAPALPDVSRLTNAELDSLGANTFATFWDGERAWVSVSETSMTSGVTSWLSQFPADAIPQRGDLVLTDLMYARAAPATVYVTLLLSVLFTGTGIAMEPSTELIQNLRVLHPTLLFLSTYGAQCVEQSVWMPSTASPLWSLMRRMNMDLLRNGVLPKDRLLDRLVCKGVRHRVGLDHVRAAIITGDGCAAEQSLVDSLRLYLGVPVMHAYVPRRLESQGMSSMVTAPVCTSNMYDLQVFAPQLLRDDSARCLPASVGPPSVSLELKLVQDSPAVKAHAEAIERLRADGCDDPIGEVYVRGYTVSKTGHNDTRISPWHNTGDVALVRTNGTFVVVAPRGANEAGMMPNTITSTDASDTLIRQQTPRRVTRTTAMLTLLLCVSCVDAHGMKRSLHPQDQLMRRGEDHHVNTTMIDQAFSGIMSMQRASWEQGVLQSAVTEYYYPQWSVFKKPGHELYPKPKTLSIKDQPIDLLRLAMSSIDGQDSAGRLASVITGDESTGRGASMDSASCGEGVLVGAWIREGFPNNKPDARGMFGHAAQKQLEYLLHNVTRTPSGALSQRAGSSDPELWSDSAYMGPPFFAFYGLVTNNQTLVQMAFDQLRLQHKALARTEGTGRNLWHHIVRFPNARNKSDTQLIDARVWLTGNGWAAAGMLRVAAIISQSPWTDKMKDQYHQLLDWAEDIVSATYFFVDRGTGLMRNVVDNPKTFYDGSGSALMAYAAFRLGSMDEQRRDQIQWAENAYQTLSRALDPFSQFTNGIQTVNEMSSGEVGVTSTESLAFLILMSAARRDYYQGNTTGTGGAVDPPAPDSSAASVHVRTTVVACTLIAACMWVMVSSL